MKVESLRVFRYRLPLAAPLALRGRTLRERRGALVRIESDAGASGWGDVAPLPGFSRESLDDAEAELAAMAEHLRSVALEVRMDELDSWMDLNFPKVSPSVRFGIETALSGTLRAAERPADPAWPYIDGSVPISGLLAGARQRVLESARELRRSGYRAAKLKVGTRPLSEDIDLVPAVQAVLGDDIGLRLDANRSWSLAQAVAFGRAIGGSGVEYVEEPLRDPTRLTEFFDATGVAVALDESLLELRPDDLVERGPAGAVIVKPTFLGGTGPARRWIARALELNIRPVVSGCFESGVGHLALAELAWTSTGDRIPAGLDTYRWLDADVMQPRLPLHEGAIRWDTSLARSCRIDQARLSEIPAARRGSISSMP